MHDNNELVVMLYVKTNVFKKNDRTDLYELLELPAKTPSPSLKHPMRRKCEAMLKLTEKYIATSFVCRPSKDRYSLP